MENKTCKLWVARDKDKKLYLYDSKPKRDCDCGAWCSDLSCVCVISSSLFPDLTWEDEPVEVFLQPTITDLDAKAKEYANSITDNEELREMIVNAFKAGYKA